MTLQRSRLHRLVVVITAGLGSLGPYPVEGLYLPYLPNESAECVPVVLSDDTLFDRQELTHCKFVVGPNYQIMGPSGELVLSTDELEGQDGFSVGVDGTFTVKPMPPPPLGLTLDTENAISLLVSPESGGVLTTAGSDGTAYTLEIPPNAFPGDPVEITMTPIAAVSDLPLSGGFHWGVHLAPDGLRLYEQATLTISPSTSLPPDALPGRYRESGEGFHLYPMLDESGDLVFGIAHFSGVLVGSGNDADIQGLQSQWALASESYSQELTLALLLVEWRIDQMSQAEMTALFVPIFTDWFTSVIFPLLNQTIACGEAECDDFWKLEQQAGDTFWTWFEDSILFGVDSDPGLASLRAQWFQTAADGFARVYSVWSQSCQQSPAYCDKVSRMDEIQRLLEMMVMITTVPQSWYESMCGGFLNTEVDDITIHLESTVIQVDEAVPISFTPENYLGEEVSLVEGVHYGYWWTSDSDVARVYEVTAEDPREAEIWGFGKGTGTIGAVLLECGDPDVTYEDMVEITVVGPPTYEVTWNVTLSGGNESCELADGIVVCDPGTTCQFTYDGQNVCQISLDEYGNSWSGGFSGVVNIEYVDRWDQTQSVVEMNGAIDYNYVQNFVYLCSGGCEPPWCPCVLGGHRTTGESQWNGPDDGPGIYFDEGAPGIVFVYFDDIRFVEEQNELYTFTYCSGDVDESPSSSSRLAWPFPLRFEHPYFNTYTPNVLPVPWVEAIQRYNLVFEFQPDVMACPAGPPLVQTWTVSVTQID